MNSLALRTVILWMHAIAGAAWVGGSLCFVIAAVALGTEGEDARAFAGRVAPAINRVALLAMIFILLSGMVNIYIAGTMRRFSFSNTFVAVLGAKIGIFLAMFALLTASFREETKLSASSIEQSERAFSRLILLNGGMIALGATALILGLWLLGS
jgi:putative copper export protein